MAPQRDAVVSRARLRKQLRQVDGLPDRVAQAVATMRPGDRALTIVVRIEPPRDADDTAHVRVLD
ncbi:MAG TPA: hypothetical protein VF576_00100 [Rubricoccaceae bacterium]|jgi:hypothetical protein